MNDYVNFLRNVFTNFVVLVASLAVGNRAEAQGSVTDSTQLIPFEVRVFSMTPPCYAAGDTLTVSLQIRNSNATAGLTLSYKYNPEFEFLPSSLTADNLTLGMPKYAANSANQVVPGSVYFENVSLPQGVHRISMKFKAPPKTGTVQTVDSAGNLQYDKAGNRLIIPFVFGFDFVSANSKSVCAGVDSVFFCSKIMPSQTVVPVPLAQRYIACQFANVKVGFLPMPDMEYYWYDYQYNTPENNGNASNTFTVTKDGSQRQYIVAEPRYQGVPLSRIIVAVEISPNCGTINPRGCVKTGTLIWKEDFDSYGDGLNPGSRRLSNEGLPPGMTTYHLAGNDNMDSPTVYNEGYYALLKYGENYWIANACTDDHTSPNNRNIGRAFLGNGKSTPDKVYQQTIPGVCPGTDLLFSFWMKASDTRITWTVYSGEDSSVLVTFTQPWLSGINNPWGFYGFNFTVPPGVHSVFFDIYNNDTRAGGNDFVIDDIEVRLCAPEAEIHRPQASDTIICSNALYLSGTYEDDGTFGADLAYCWEHSPTGAGSWTTVAGSSGVSNNGKVVSNHYIGRISNSNQGYYRFAINGLLTDILQSPNCRSISRLIHVHAHETLTPPDIRVYVSPTTNPSINLSSWLDVTNYSYSINWSAVPPSPPFVPGTATTTGTLNVGAWSYPETHTYKYTTSTAECGTRGAKAYIHTLKKNIFKQTDTIYFCRDLSLTQYIQLNQIFGLTLDNNLVIPNDPDNAISNNITTITGGNNSGAKIFNGIKAFADAGSSYDYNGDSSKKMFEFIYVSGIIRRKIVLIIF